MRRALPPRGPPGSPGGPRARLAKKGARPPGGPRCCGRLHGCETDVSCQLLWADGSHVPSRSSTQPTPGRMPPCRPSMGLAASARRVCGRCLHPRLADRLTHADHILVWSESNCSPRATYCSSEDPAGWAVDHTRIRRDGGDSVLLRHGDRMSITFVPSSVQDFQNSSGLKENTLLFNWGWGRIKLYQRPKT